MSTENKRKKRIMEAARKNPRLPLFGELIIEQDEEEWSKDVDVEKGKMKELLDIPADEKVIDHYDSGEKLARDLIDKVGRDEASSMLAFAANIDPEENVLDDALSWMGDNPPEEE